MVAIWNSIFAGEAGASAGQPEPVWCDSNKVLEKQHGQLYPELAEVKSWTHYYGGNCFSSVCEDWMWQRERMWMYDALFTPEICLSNDILEFRGTPNLDIDDWSLVEEPATDIDCIDSAKIARGLDFELKK